MDKYKARLVAKGFSSEKKDFVYVDTFALDAKIISIRLLIALDVIHNDYYQMDAKPAFSTGDLEEETYVKQPEEFIAPGQ